MKKHITVTIIFILSVFCVAWATAPGKACPQCKKPFKNGDYACTKMMNGEFVPVCFIHAFEESQEMRIAAYKKLAEKK